jgi:hypothetical protein
MDAGRAAHSAGSATGTGSAAEDSGRHSANVRVSGGVTSRDTARLDCRCILTLPLILPLITGAVPVNCACR